MCGNIGAFRVYVVLFGDKIGVDHTSADCTRGFDTQKCDIRLN
jgi:hypothetical protein